MFGVYVHVPWCAARCGYCDFNTYTTTAGRDLFAARAAAELALHGPLPPADTVFFGGGTPTLLPSGEFTRVLGAIELTPGAEVTVEANPETVDERSLAELRDAGFTRISIGMQSARPHVLAALDRRHAPGAPERAAQAAHAAGFEHVSLDLIYGAAGETDADWRASLHAALSAHPDHVSAYALTLERGTALAARVARGELPPPDPDVQARRYEIADALLSEAGLAWYEISNWAASDDARCRHNLGYWRGDDWLGIGPGAHSHAGGVRWWNVLHPAEWAARVDAGRPPVAGREALSSEQRALECVMLGIRTREGLALSAGEATAARALQADGLVRVQAGRAVLTLRGRLLADTVVDRLSGRPRTAAPR